MTSGISISTLEIRQEKTSRFYLRVEWTSPFKGFYWRRGCCLESTVFTVKNSARSCYVAGWKKNPDLASTRFRVHMAYSKIFTLKSGFKKFQIHRIRTSRLKPYPERKKLWIQKYPDTCRRGLIILIFSKRWHVVHMSFASGVSFKFPVYVILI